MVINDTHVNHDSIVNKYPFNTYLGHAINTASIIFFCFSAVVYLINLNAARKNSFGNGRWKRTLAVCFSLVFLLLLSLFLEFEYMSAGWGQISQISQIGQFGQIKIE